MSKKREKICAKKKKTSAGGEISMPTEPTTDRLQQLRTEKLKSGEYTIGEMIVPKEVSIILVFKTTENNNKVSLFHNIF